MSKMIGRVALVVGGASGIGLAIASRLARDGAKVFLTGRRSVDVERAAGEVGHDAQGITGDASDPADIERIMQTVQTAAGRIDALVLNAGHSESATAAEATLEHVERLFAVNARGPALAMRAAIPLMSRGTSVVLMSSVAASRGSPGNGAYSASKAALKAFGHTWAAELGPQGIRVNILTPGPTDTAMFAGAPDEMRKAIAQRIPLGRMGRAEDVAAAAAFLLSDEAGFVTGADLAVDGGLLVT